MIRGGLSGALSLALVLACSPSTEGTGNSADTGSASGTSGGAGSGDDGGDGGDDGGDGGSGGGGSGDDGDGSDGGATGGDDGGMTGPSGNGTDSGGSSGDTKTPDDGGTSGGMTSSGGNTTTGDPGNENYPPCSATCPMYDCRTDWSGLEWCAPGCFSDAECPEARPGGGLELCYFGPGGIGECSMRCDANGDCPPGMECFNATWTWLCGWP